MDINFSGRQTDVPERFRKHATAKLNKLEKLDQKAIRVDVEVSVERNPRQSSQKERVELTVRSRGPAIRAEAAAEDRFSALDLALAKLESRLRRAHDRRKNHHGHGQVRLVGQPEGDVAPLPSDIVPAARPATERPAAHPGGRKPGGPIPGGQQRQARDLPPAEGQASQAQPDDDVVPIPMEGDGPLVLRQKFHHARPMTIDQALLEMELVGHDFYLFTDSDCRMPSVVYRRRGYQYGVLRLVDSDAPASQGSSANGHSVAAARAGAAPGGPAG
jgi:ribosomal subunit interface protein